MFRFFVVAILSVIASMTLAQSTYYFQQEVNYKIDVTLDDKNHTLSAFEEMEYINNSNQDLEYLIIHLWPNAYKNAKTALAKQKFESGDFFLLWAGQQARGYIDSLDFQIDGRKARWEYLKGYEDIAVIYLESPVPAGGSVKISTPFFVKLPSGAISRLGHIGQSYQITQWYPKPAVFDKNGWHEMPYLNQGEFYSEFGSFDVKITLPENYTVGATGNLQTTAEIERLNELASKAFTAINNAKPGQKEEEFPASSANMKTLHYKQSNVHDFGWFADKRWIVRKGEVELPHSKKKVTTWAMFTPGNSAAWEKKGIQSINDGLYYYSLWSGDYPYDVCTAVDGTISAGGGMEYPNVTVIGSTGSESTLQTVIIHEVGHNWFYGILGSNERDNAWMDEGLNSFFETRTILKVNPKTDAVNAMAGGLNISKALGLDKFSYQYLTEELPYLMSARGHKDQPMQAPSEYFTGMNYGTIVYKKSALAFNYLMNSLGEDLFNQCMADYFETWKFKHPAPADIKASFEKTCSKDLNWFFDDLINTTNHVDYKACRVKMEQDVAELTVKNDGELSGPFSVDVIRDGKLQERIWFEGIAPLEKTVVRIPAIKGDLLKLNQVQGIPEYNRNNNNIRTAGILKRTEPYKLKMLTSIDDPETSQLFWNPLVGWNEYNKWMIGVQLHNQTFPKKNYVWSLSPMYSISTSTLNGFARLEYDNGKIGFGVRGQRFAQAAFPFDDKKYVTSYDVIAPYIHAALFPDRLRKDLTGDVKVTFFSLGEMIRDEESKFIGDYTQVYPRFGDGPRLSHVRIEAFVKKKLPRAEFRFESSFEGGEYTQYGVMHQYSFNYDWIYKGKGKRKIKARVYYGGGDGFYLAATGQYGGMRYDKNSPYNAIAGDYVYDGLFLGRNETSGILSQQFMRTQGGLAAPTQQTANGHVITLNTEVDVPFKLPVAFYAGLGILKNRKDVTNLDVEFLNEQSTNSDTRVLWNAGVALPLIPGIFKIYMPLVYSSDIKEEVDARGLDFGETILFELNLNMANPFVLINSIGQ